VIGGTCPEISRPCSPINTVSPELIRFNEAPAGNTKITQAMKIRKIPFVE
jgi:hypothetical protein